jgi:uncharacterized protein (DUF1778 family)
MAAKEDRLQIRVGPLEKRLLERAAEASHQSVSAFVLQAAALHAEQTLADRSIIRLSPDAFNEALARPARVNERLTAALSRPRSFKWID